MRVLILGVTGMLGHKLWQQYNNHFETWGTVRSGIKEIEAYHLFDPQRIITSVDAFNFDSVINAVARVRPDVIINSIGIIKQLPSAKDPVISLTINSLFPHRLANLCQASGIRLIHISTDCVFSGRKGNYTETDISDAEDLYGKSKYLGEVDRLGCLTLRTSIIGRELQTTSGLVEWFLGNNGGNVRGYTQAIYSGFTTLALAKIIESILMHHPDLSGVYQVSADPINKYELLLLLKDAFGINIEIEPYGEVQIDRSLDSSRFRTATGFEPSNWFEMTYAMAKDPTPYEKWRK